MAKTWVVEKVRENELADTLNRLEKDERYELHGIYATAEAGAFLVVGSHREKRKAVFGTV
jgi:hypothetical protein